MTGLTPYQFPGTIAALQASEAHYAFVIRDQPSLFLVTDEDSWRTEGANASESDRFGLFQVVSTDGKLPVNVIGFLRPILEELNNAGIRVGPQCGAIFDYRFIFGRDIVQAELVLATFLERGKEQVA